MVGIRRRRVRRVLCFVFAAAALGAAGAPAARADAPANPLLVPRSLTARRVDTPIRIDGVLDEAAWAAAPVAAQFMQQGPHPGEPAELRTTFRVLFDDQAIYVGVRLADPVASAIQAPLGRRDDENASDWCFVEIDSRRDRRSGFSFGVNPAGLQVDGVWLNDSAYDATWNAVWEAAAHVDGSGWTAEYRIPFSVLAFAAPAAGEPMRWGINIYRHNPRTGESSNWSPRMPQLAGIVSLFNELVIDAAPTVHRLDLTPYLLTQLAHPGATSARAGLDVNVGIAPGVSASATLLPDFGQVEADPTQLNLTAFELFQTERRPFFTEGIDAFQFDTSLALVTRDDSFANEAAFYTRRIGRAPEGDIPAGQAAPPATDILGAVKLFGRTTSGWRAGVLAAATEGADATGATGTTQVAAATQTAIARVVREADSGDAAVGMFASGLHRDVSGPLADQLVRDATALGADGRVRWSEQTYEARAWALATDQLGTSAAITRLADAPWHYLQRPDAPRLHLAAGATRLDGLAAATAISKVGGELTWNLDARAISPGFDVNGIGFQRNSDWAIVSAAWSYHHYVHSAWLRDWQVGSDNAGLGWSWGGERRAAVADGFVLLDFANYWNAQITLQHEFSVLSTEWLRGGPALALPPRELAKLSLHSDTRRSTTASLDAALTSEPGSHSRMAMVTPALTLRLSDHVAATLGATLADQQIGWQLVAGPGPGAAPADTYLVGRLHERTASVSLQTDIAISPRLIVQLYAQPFATVGRYDHYALLADPRAQRPDDRFTSLAADEVGGDAETLMIRGPRGFSIARPDGVQRTLLASAVARWELSPGSFLTAVWSHRGSAAITTQLARLGPALGDAAVEPGSDVALIKLGWRWAP